ncbi:MAG: 4-hydroxy-tetrahydrodipicolinate synthase [Clostridiales bacterium]|nr:4-hydroxy-tetrahydrodipicolinate synthase [Clostridiales bacterium]
MKKPVFEGLATAIVTPFKNGTIDIPTFEMLLDAQLAANVDAIVVCGTTGESATLSAQEQLALIAHAIQYTAGRCKIIAGTGSNDTAHAIDMSRAASSMGACAVLVVTPYYNKCTQAGLIAHYTAIADAVSCPVICYNVPSRTGVDMTLETYQALSKHPNIQGVKEAGGSPAKIAKTIETCADDFFVWSGNDDEAVCAMALGAKGLISVLSNVRPKKTLAMLRACQQNDFRRAGALQRELMELIGALFCVVNPIPVKKALELEGIPVGNPRLPLTAFPAEKLPLLKAALAKTPDA